MHYLGSEVSLKFNNFSVFFLQYSEVCKRWLSSMVMGMVSTRRMAMASSLQWATCTMGSRGSLMGASNSSNRHSRSGTPTNNNSSNSSSRNHPSPRFPPLPRPLVRFHPHLLHEVALLASLLISCALSSKLPPSPRFPHTSLHPNCPPPPPLAFPIQAFIQTAPPPPPLAFPIQAFIQTAPPLPSLSPYKPSSKLPPAPSPRFPHTSLHPNCPPLPSLSPYKPSSKLPPPPPPFPLQAFIHTHTHPCELLSLLPLHICCHCAVFPPQLQTR